MRRSRRTALAAAPITALACIAFAFAQPRVPVASVEIAPGTVFTYLASHMRSGGPSSPGVHYQGGAGLCFEASSSRSTTYACFRKALLASGLSGTIEETGPYTVFAPTDAAFAHLAETLGSASVRRLTTRRAAASELVRYVLAPGTHTLGALAFGVPAGGGGLTLANMAGTGLRIEVGPAAASSGSRTVAVGPAAGVDGQAYASGVSVRFADGSILVPVDRIPLDALMPPH